LGTPPAEFGINGLPVFLIYYKNIILVTIKKFLFEKPGVSMPPAGPKVNSVPLNNKLILPGMTAFIFLSIASLFCGAAPQKPAILYGSVCDEYGKPVADLEVRIQIPDGAIHVIHTDGAGKFEFFSYSTGEHKLSLGKSGFFRLENMLIYLHEGTNEVSFTVNHETEIHQEIEVYYSSQSISTLDTSNTETLIAREIRDIPVSSTHDLRSSLQTLPEVVRDHQGQIHIAGGRTGEAQYLLDGFDVGDPVTGDFSLRLNVDSVRDVEVESARYGVQYGNAGAGVLALNSASGDDRLRASATNFFPGISTQKGIHLTSWYPRFTLSGPLKKGRIWFYEALSLQHTLSLVEDLPRDEDSTSQWAGDNLLRFQIKLAPKNILQVGYLYNQRNASNIGLGPFSPISTTRGLREYRSLYSLKEQIWTSRTFYELGFAADVGHSEIRPQGFEPYRLTPEGAAGNYFEYLHQKTQRWQALGSISMPTRRRAGTHDLQLGFHISKIKWFHQAQRNPIEVIRSDGSLAQHTFFVGSPKFTLGNTALSAYAYDVWRPSRALVLQSGIRVDRDQIVKLPFLSPRFSVNYLPFKNGHSKFTAAWGIFLQPVRLSVLGPAHDQNRIDIFYGSQRYNFVFGSITSRFSLPEGSLKQPRFYSISFGFEQSITDNSLVKFNFAFRKGRLGLAYEKADSDLSRAVYVLANNRRDDYRSFQVSWRHNFSDKSSISIAYTRSRAQTNQLFDYSLDTLILNPQEKGPLDWDAPNRIVSSGWTSIPLWSLFLSYFLEYRTGFPFSAINERQQLVGPANRLRFPDYANLNIGIEKRFRFFKRVWALRLVILNITSHSNPDGVINNVDSPNFMKFSGGQKRSLTARLRLLR